MNNRILPAIGLSAALAMSAAARAEETPARLITLSGHGEVMKAPDMAMLSMGVNSNAATAGEALAANSTSMQALLAALKQAGIDEKDIQTSDFTVQPRLDYGSNNTGQPPKVVGYDVVNMVRVTVREIPALGGILDKAVQSGSNQIGGISFAVKDQQAALDEARKMAVADAIRKADVYAAAAGVALGQIVSISESGGYSPPVPMRARAMAAEAAPPIAAGQQTLAIDVNITWEIK
jgi:uncharacterized protein YggE